MNGGGGVSCWLLFGCLAGHGLARLRLAGAAGLFRRFGGRLAVRLGRRVIASLIGQCRIIGFGCLDNLGGFIEDHPSLQRTYLPLGLATSGFNLLRRVFNALDCSGHWFRVLLAHGGLVVENRFRWWSGRRGL